MRRQWKAMEGNGRRWKAMEGDGRQWKAMDRSPLELAELSGGWVAAHDLLGLVQLHPAAGRRRHGASAHIEHSTATAQYRHFDRRHRAQRMRSSGCPPARSQQRLCCIEVERVLSGVGGHGGACNVASVERNFYHGAARSGSSTSCLCRHSGRWWPPSGGRGGPKGSACGGHWREGRLPWLGPEEAGEEARPTPGIRVGASRRLFYYFI